MAEETTEEQQSTPIKETTMGKELKKAPFSVRFEVDLMQLGLFVVALMTRTWQLGVPRAVVFDELHFSKFISMYLKRIFFFDGHPPFGTMLLALTGGYTGFEGDIGFDRIGADYPAGFPVKELRLVPAVCGSLVVPLVYQIAVEMGLSRWAALLAGAFILLDNALLVQSRFVLLEGILLCFMSCALLGVLKFRNLSHREFSLQWWFWLCFTGVSFTFAVSTKYVGAFTVVLVLYIVCKDYWKKIADFTVTDLQLLMHFLARVVTLVMVPCFIYVYIFYVHLSILTKAGPHDNVMTSAFQASLEGGLATLTKGQPLYIAYGSQITLRHTYDKNPGSRPCWLHSHAHVYPVRYKDGRGSSHQQQVTCYTFKDVNNWWIVKNPDKEEMVLDDPVQPVKHGDIVQLVHGLTSRALNSHDVAAPLTPQCQEVSCYINYNVSMPPQNLWKVQIINRANDNSKWETIKSHVRLVHVQTNQALKTTGLSLPEWGFNQLEVATDRHMQQDATIWNVEEHRYNKNEDKEGRLRDIQQAELIPMEPTYVSFWEKFWELQTKMLFGAPPADIEHKYRSNPLDWPFVSKNVAYWMHATTNAQIHLLGNTVVWVTGTLSVLSLCALLAFYLLRRRRGFHELNTDEWKDFLFLIDFIVVGYFLHYLPYFLTDRTLFLHHYLPCMLFKVLAVAAILDHIEMLCRSYVTSHSSMVTRYVVVALVAMATWVFIQLSCVTYGNVSLTAADVKRLSWRESWDFLLHQIGS